MYNRVKIVPVTARCNCWDIVALVIGDGSVRWSSLPFARWRSVLQLVFGLLPILPLTP